MKKLGLVFGVLSLIVAGEARGEDAKPVGHLPLIQVGPMFGMSMTPVRYEKGRFDENDPPEFDIDTVSSLAVGAELKLRVDAGAGVFHADGFYNALSKGVLGYGGRAGFLLATGAGGRSTTSLVEYAGRTETSTTVTEHYNVHTKKTLPLVYGLDLAASALTLRDAVRDKIGLTAEARRAGTTLFILEPGFGLIGGQVEVFAGPTFELTTQRAGAHWSLQYAFPIGSFPLYFRFGGDHLFGAGESTPLRFALMASIGLGSSLGVSTSSE
jgi:hypothetical protein